MARVHRPALTPAGPDGPSAESARRAVEAVWRIESARIVGALTRYTGDFALAEDVAPEALAQALVAWPRDGTPANPVGWLLATGRRRAIDAFRRQAALDERYAALASQLAEGEATSGAAAPPGSADPLWDPDQIDDDVLALMFVACHPVLSPEARVALTLRVVGGLTSEEIARAFLRPAIGHTWLSRPVARKLGGGERFHGGARPGLPHARHAPVCRPACRGRTTRARGSAVRVTDDLRPQAARR